MHRPLRDTIRKTLDDLTDWANKGTRANTKKFTELATPPVERDALEYLTSKGCLTMDGVDGPFRLTPKGWDYHEELRCPLGFWFKNNWFPAIVALGTSTTSVASIVIAISTR